MQDRMQYYSKRTRSIYDQIIRTYVRIRVYCPHNGEGLTDRTAAGSVLTSPSFTEITTVPIHTSYIVRNAYTLTTLDAS